MSNVSEHSPAQVRAWRMFWAVPAFSGAGLALIYSGISSTGFQHQWIGLALPSVLGFTIAFIMSAITILMFVTRDLQSENFFLDIEDRFQKAQEEADEEEKERRLSEINKSLKEDVPPQAPVPNWFGVISLIAIVIAVAWPCLVLVVYFIGSLI